MLFVSEITGKNYKTAEDCLAAEAQYKKAEEEKRMIEKQKSDERAADAKRLDEAYEVVLKAQQAYQEEFNKFVKKHGKYHFSINSLDDIPQFLLSYINTH